MSDKPSGRTAKCLGEARDLATFLQVVDGWVSITPALGVTIQLFRGQEDELWLLKTPFTCTRCSSFQAKPVS